MNKCDDCEDEFTLSKYGKPPKYINLCINCRKKKLGKNHRQKYKEKINASKKKWNQRNKEKIKEYSKKYNQEHRIYKKEYNKKYLKKKVEAKFGYIKEPCFIYKITNLITKQFYIGKTTDYKRRFSVHQSRLRKLRHENSRLQDDWNFYGEDVFEYKIILICDRMNLTLYEYKTIKNLKPYYNAMMNSYNNKGQHQLCCICEKEKIYVPHMPLCKNCFELYGKNKKYYKEYPDWLKFLIYNQRQQSKALESFEIPFSWLEKPYKWTRLQWDYDKQKSSDTTQQNNSELVAIKKGLK